MIQFTSVIQMTPDYNNHGWLISHNGKSHNWPHEERPSLLEVAQLLEKEKDANPISLPDGKYLSVTLSDIPNKTVNGSNSSNHGWPRKSC